MTKKEWWGEGEMKVHMDGDADYPTICGTGSEDYVGISWGMQETPFMYNGCCLNRKDASGANFVTMYRWHLPDPIAWLKEARITIQQIAHTGKLRETSDDWSCATFWYEPVPSAPLPKMPRPESPHGGHLGEQKIVPGNMHRAGFTGFAVYAGSASAVVTVAWRTDC